MDCTPGEGLHRENLFLNHLKLLDWSVGVGPIPKRVRPEIEFSGPDDAVPVLLGPRLNTPNIRHDVLWFSSLVIGSPS
jgi:hypothetical protein